MKRPIAVLAGMLILLLPCVAAAQPSLPAELHQRVTQLSQAGDALAERGEYRQAILKYVEALELLPEPMTDWEACTWLLAAVGDANFLAGDHEYARRALSDAMHCPGAVGNPFLHLRLGQAQFELGNPERAADELVRAYMGAGEEIFADEDPKYLAFLRRVTKSLQ